MERDAAGPQSQKLLEKIGMKKEDAVPLKDLGLIFLWNWLKLRPCEKFLASFCTSALLKALKINLLYPKKTDGQAFRSSLDNFDMVST